MPGGSETSPWAPTPSDPDDSGTRRVLYQAQIGTATARFSPHRPVSLCGLAVSTFVRRTFLTRILRKRFSPDIPHSFFTFL